jgi:3'-phosphoadenosine 5'-phosphosulfate sulfotransferase (PAPS reductase)/FAD synthetase
LRKKNRSGAVRPYGVYCVPDPNIQLKRLGDVYEEVRKKTGIVPILTGAKRDDGQWRRTNTEEAKTGAYQEVYRPIYEWTTYDVVGFCKLKGIPLPKAENAKNTGIDLSTKFVLWAYNNEPQAYERLCEEFPFLPAMIYREHWFNVSGKQLVREV